MKNWLACLCLLFFVPIAQGQNGFGVKGGLNYSTIGIDGQSESSQIWSYHLGLFTNKQLKRLTSFRPELVYSVQGADSEISKSKIRISYINIPLIFSLGISKNFGINLGPQIGIAVRGVDKFDNTIITSTLNTIDLAAAIGLYATISQSIQLETRYNIGFSNIDATAPLDETYNNLVLQISLSYWLKPGKAGSLFE